MELYLKRGVRRAEAAAYMGLNPMVVRFAYSGVKRLPDGRVDRKNHLFAKISRPEVAARFLSPAPAEILDTCVRNGWLTRDEAELARSLPVAEDITVEADSGGHTDNQPLVALFPVILGVRDELAAKYGYHRPIRVGAAGGLSTPESVAAAFALGAAYVLTGSVNQSCIESGLSDEGKKMLAQADLPDVVMTPAADMFELGVQVQVLKRGTMFGVRAQRLYDLYVAHDSIESLPGGRARAHREGAVPDVVRRGVGGLRAVLRRARPGRARARRARAEAQDGADLPLVSRHVQQVGDRRGPEAPRRLPDLVRPGHGRVQPLGQGVVPRGPGAPHRGPGRAQPARGRGRRHARAAAPDVRRPRAERRIPLHSSPARLSA